MSKEKVRVTLDLSPEVYARLAKLEEDSGAHSKAETMRRAMAFYELLVAAHNRGEEVVFETRDGARQKLAMAL